MFEPGAVVHHHVPATGGRWAYFRARCWSEGLSKAAVARLSDPRRALSAERRYVSRVLPRAVLRGLHESVTRARPEAAARAAAVVAGLILATAGYAAGRIAVDAAEPRTVVQPLPSHRHPSQPRSGELMTTAAADSGRTWLTFDIHGLARIRVQRDVPSIRQLAPKLAGFATDREMPADIVIGAANLVPARRHVQDEAAMLDGLPCMVMRMPRVYSAETASDHFVAVLTEVLPTIVAAEAAATGNVAR
jgi:hypothetical protein